LIKNEHYDSKVVGKYCEERNPDLAFIAYKRAWGSCDDELIEVANKNYLFRAEARYLVERSNPELWKKVLDAENENRQQIIDQVVQTALPEIKDVDQVAATVSAFIEADLPSQLIDLLERIVLHNSDFAANPDLQNLLILTAIRSETGRCMDYINRLDNYDGIKLANIAKEPQHKLYEEALCIYKKFNKPVEAIQVLLYNIEDIKLATEFADKTNKPEVWLELAKAQLELKNLHETIDAFIKAENADHFDRVINLSQEQSNYEEIIAFLLMARKFKKEQRIDSELIFAYAMGGERFLAELESFVTEPNQADILASGERCFDNKHYLSAEILFKRINNNHKLAQTYVMLKKYQAAYDAAKKADVPKVWKAVCFACVRAKEFRMASLCGQNIIIHPDHLEEVIQHYEKFGYWEELINLLETGMSLERTHNGIYTDLGILFGKYQPARLMDHIRTYAQAQKLLIPKLIRACEQYQMWPEAVHLHSIYDQQDQAILTMMEHSPSAWRHDIFSQNIVNVANNDLYYRAMIFYLEEEPLLLNDMLKLISPKIDLTKSVQVMKRTGHVALIAPFLKSVQSQNISAVNECLNEIYLENEDFESLRNSIKEYDSFESLNLAGDLESHELLDGRRIAALLYRKGKKFQKSIDISKKDELYKDAMETVAESRDPVLCEDLMRYIMTMKDKELFAAMLYTCYDLIKPDVALEVAWRQDLQEFVMPYFIQFVKDLTTRVEVVQKGTEDIKKKEDQKAEEQMNRPLDMDMNMMFPGMAQPTGGPMAIMPQGGMNMGGGFNANPMGQMGGFQ